MHTVHLHDVDQQCLTRNGGPCLPYETMKETWFLGPGETLEIKVRFTDHTGKYVFHCHILEHEDDGMMAQFEVVEPDSDGDGFNDAEEAFVGTDPNDPCADTPVANDEADDKWPPDFDDNQTVNILDIVQMTPPVFGSTVGEPDYSQRKDFNGDGAINIIDIVRLTPPVFNSSCTP